MTGRWLELRPPAARDALLVQRELGTLLGLARYGAPEAAAKSAEFLLLRHRVVFSHRTGEPGHPVMLKLHSPAPAHGASRPSHSASRQPSLHAE